MKGTKQDFFEQLMVDHIGDGVERLPLPHADDFSADDLHSARVVFGYAALRDLPDKLRRIFLAANFERLSFSAIGKRFGFSRQRAHELYRLADKRLKRSPYVRLLAPSLDKKV